MAACGLLLSDDLLFSSRITGTARSLGLDLRTLRTGAALQGEIARQQPACVLVDLQHPDLSVTELATSLKSKGPCTLVAFGSHVATEALRQAREAGCDVVLPRSQFVETLAQGLPEWFGVTRA